MPYRLSGWRPPPEHAAMARYFASLVKPALQFQDEHGAFAAKYVLDKLVWGVTTCTDKHKWNVRYISAGVKPIFVQLQAAVAAGTKTATWKQVAPGLRHEHVVPRRELVAALLAGGGEPGALLDTETCIVTVTEDGRLPKGGSGWTRYRQAKVPVWDRKIGDWLIPPTESTP